MQNALLLLYQPKVAQSDLRRCIVSILHQTIIPYELVIVDAGEIAVPECFFEPFRKVLDIHYIPAQVGLTRARNIGIQKSTGDPILFLDDDTELEPDYIEKMADVFSADSKHQIGGVSGKIIDPQEGQNLPLFLKIRLTGRKIIGRLFFLPVEKDGCFHPAGFPTSPPLDAQDIMPVQCLYGAEHGIPA